MYAIVRWYETHFGSSHPRVAILLWVPGGISQVTLGGEGARVLTFPWHIELPRGRCARPPADSTNEQPALIGIAPPNLASVHAQVVAALVRLFLAILRTSSSSQAVADLELVSAVIGIPSLRCMATTDPANGMHQDMRPREPQQAGPGRTFSS